MRIRTSLMFFLVLAALFSSSAALKAGPAPAKIRIVATVFPLAEFAREIAGERGEIRLILPPGADVHTWQPRVSDIRKLETADLLVFVGQGLEPWLGSLLGGADVSKLVKFEAAAGLTLLTSGPHEEGEAHEHGAFDPHVWLDFQNDVIIAGGIARALARIEPASEAFFSRNAAALADKLRALDASFREGLASCRGREFVLGGHAAFAYLAHRYGLRQVPLYGVSPDAAPTPKDVASIIARAKKDGVKTIFFEPNVGDKMARLIASEVGANTLVLYPGHNLSPEQSAAGATFFGLMRTNLENLKNGLGCR